MRPIKLVMNAFGPYLEQTTIDFSDFDRTSLFLITGNTGSGKTMIFDAISFALYGGLSGDKREAKAMKSDHAPTSEIAYVEFTFEEGNQQFFIRREPEQESNGKTNRPHKVTLEKPGQKVVTKVTEVKEEITEILGLSQDQFRQIVMLPQGEFEKVLLSSSEDKEAILRSIFNTQVLDRMGAIFKDRLSQAKKERDQYVHSVENTLKNLRLDQDKDQDLRQAVQAGDYLAAQEELEKKLAADDARLKSLNHELENAEDQLKGLSSVIEKIEEKNQLEEKLAKLKDQTKEVDSWREKVELHEKADKLAGPKKSFQEAQAKLDQIQTEKKSAFKEEELLKTQVKRIEQEFIELEMQYKQLDQDRKHQAKLEREVEHFNKLSLNQESIAKLSHELEELDQSQKNLESEFSNLSKAQTDLRENLKQIKPWREELDQLVDHLNIQENELKDLTHQVKMIEAIQAKQKQAEQAYKAYKELDLKLSQQDSLSRSVNDHYHANLAGILASNLEEGQPCQVCGSTHHPSLASLDTEAVSKDLLDEERAKLNQVQSERDKKQATYENLSTDVSQLAQEESLEVTHLSERLEESQTKISASQSTTLKFKEKEKELREKLDREEGWIQKQADLQQVEKELTENKHGLSQDSLYKEKEKARLEQDNQDLNQKLTYETQDLAEKELKTLSQKITQVDHDYQAKKDEVNRAQTDSAQLTTKIQGLENQESQLQTEVQEKGSLFQGAIEDSDLDADFEKYLLASRDLAQAKELVSDYDKKLYHTQESLKTNQQVLSQYDNLQDLAVYQADLADLSQKLPDLKQKIANLSKDLTINQENFKTFQESLKHQAHVEDKLNTLQDLSSYTNGNEQTNHTSFERYVLGVYFDHVLERGNKRLVEMTGGRYRMVRRTKMKANRGKQGLDIDIFDKYTGKARDAKTLSGGETFKASLALALGMSDFIQTQAGGISVDTLFIDEGFGTLDQESLDSAIDTLVDLNQAGRLVGIISHVEDLKTRITNQIVVKSSPQGSQVTVQAE